VEKTPVSKADSDEKATRFSEKSRGNFWWFPYGTSDEKVSHNFPENFPEIFLSELFQKCLEFPKSFLPEFFWKNFAYTVLNKILGKFTVKKVCMK